MPSISTSRAPGIALAVSRPPEGRTIRSLVPWITTVGAVIRRTSAVRSPAARIAASWRAPPGRVVAALVAEVGEPAQLLLLEREAGGADQAVRRDGRLDRALAVARTGGA